MRQTNVSFSRAGVIRGLHYHERGQDDLFACLRGTARVVVLDRDDAERRSPRTSARTTPSPSTSPGTTRTASRRSRTSCSATTSRSSTTRPIPTSTRSPGTIRASHTYGARAPRSCPRGTPPSSPDHGRRRPARPRARAGVRRRRRPRAHARRLGRHRAAPATAVARRVRPRPAHGGVDGRRRGGGRPAGCGGRERRRDGARRRARGAARDVLDRLRLRRAQALAVRRVGRPEPDCPRTAGRSSTARRPPGRTRGSSGRRGSSARPATTSCGRCSGSAPSATRSRSSTTSAAARRTSATSPRPCGELVDADLPKGLWHVAADGDCTWADFAEAIFEEAGLELPRPPDLDGGARAPGAATRVLRPAERASAERRVLPHWRDGLRACLAEMDG